MPPGANPTRVLGNAGAIASNAAPCPTTLVAIGAFVQLGRTVAATSTAAAPVTTAAPISATS